jgi:hypothetical protein
VQSGSTVLTSAWVKGANALCTKLQLELASKSLPTAPKEMLSYLQSFIDTAKAGVDRIRALKPPAGKAARVKTMLAYYDRAFTDATALIAAIKRRDVAAYQRLSAQVKNEGAVADGIAAELGATACSSNGHG